MKTAVLEQFLEGLAKKLRNALNLLSIIEGQDSSSSLKDGLF